MRLMLGRNGLPDLLVTTNDNFNPDEFDFDVVNGAWTGKFHKGYISVLRCPSGDFTSLNKMQILTNKQDRLRGEYRDVFANFDNENYGVPKSTFVAPESWDDDIPF